MQACPMRVVSLEVSRLWGVVIAPVWNVTKTAFERVSGCLVQNNSAVMRVSMEGCPISIRVPELIFLKKCDVIICGGLKA